MLKDHEVLICGARTAEVTVNKFRHAVNLEKKHVLVELGK
jgi:hypothetical protein